LPTIGVLQFVSHPALDDIYKGMVDSLAKEGFKDGETANIVFQNGQADQSKLTSMSQHLINEKSDVLVGIATPAAQALANQTQEIPIVLGAISDPKSAGLVEDNNHPGGNITGVSDQSPVEAQLELVKEILPSSKKMGILYSSAEDNSAYQAEKITAEAKKSGFDVKSYPVPSTNEISQMMQVMSKEVDFVYLPTDNTMANAMQTIVDVANQYKIPVIPSVDTMVEQGGLATVGINQYELGVKTGEMVASILKGESKPATTPIYTFDSGDIIINQKQADFLNISINQSIKDKAIIKGGE
jgi:putative ABC transport system substrate-binding protein